MDDYWTSTGHTHHIDLDAIKSLCFQLLCIFETSTALAHRYDISESEAIEEGESPDPDSDQLLRLHDELIETEASKVMLSLAMALRVYDDHLKSGPHSAAYTAHVMDKDGNKFIGGTSDQDRFNYRDACNKIIHALKMRFLTDQFDRQYGDKEIWHYTGELELTGKKGNDAWDATFYVPDFIRTVLDVIEFGYPD